MKIKNLVIIIAIGSFLSVGCSPDRLDLEPQGQLLEASFFNNEQDVYMALVTAYDPINWCYPWGSSQWATCNAASDDAHSGGDFLGDRPELDGPNYFDIAVTNEGPKVLWEKYYTGIYRCNTIFLNVESKPELLNSTVKGYVAEAKFLRAFYYFDLVRYFGDVPLITKPIGDEYSLTRDPVAKVYDQIVLDLKSAITDLPVNASQKGRIDKGAALGLLGRVYLFMSSPYWNLENHYQDAADVFGQIIALKKYELMDNYSDIFRRDNNFNKETLFELAYTNTVGMDWDASNPYNRQEGNIDWQLCGLRKPVQVGDTVLFTEGWGGIKPTSELAKAYLDNNDKVRYNAVMISGDSLAQLGITFTDPYGYDGYVRMKYQVFPQDAPSLENAWDNSTRVIRLADIYLMLAECIVNGATDPTGLGADHYVNLVRGRVKLPSKSGITMNDIILERRLELSFEGHRYWDVLRWNKGDEIFGSHKSDNSDYIWTPTKKGLWPVPQSEIERTGGSIEQNEGY